MIKHKITWGLISILIILPLILSCAPDASSTPTVVTLPAITADSLELIYEDDFSSVKWSVQPSEYVIPTYKNGEYTLTVKVADQTGWFTSFAPAHSNGVAEVDARAVSSNDSTVYGLRFRIREKEGYRFVICGDRYEIDRRFQGEWYTLVRSTESEYIKTDGSANRIRVAYLGNIIEAYINGHRVVTVTDDAISEGTLGLVYEGKDSVLTYDNIKLYRFTDAYLAKVNNQTSGTKQASVPTVGPKTVLTQQSVPSSGGTITVNKSGDPLNGLQIVVPSGAYQGSTNFTVSSQSITDPNSQYPDATPLISIDNGGVFAKEMVTVKIPVKKAADEFIMAFYYDTATGDMEGIPLLDSDADSITIATAHFSVVRNKTIQLNPLREKEMANLADSKFKPGTDDWIFPNRGTFTSYKGTCAGMSIAAMYYFTEYSRQNKKLPLFGLYQGQDPDIQEDNVEAWRLISALQKDFIASPAYLISSKVEGSKVVNDEVVYNAFAFSIHITGKPQLMGVSGVIKETNERVGHAMIVYAVRNGLKIANPNNPKEEYTLPLVSGKFGTMRDKNNKEDPDFIWDTYYYLGKSAGIFWNQVGARWNDCLNNKVDTDIFPPCQLEVVDEKGQTFELKDNMTVDSKTITIQVSYASLNSRRISLFRDKRWAQLDSNGRPVTQNKITLDLRDGPNKFGLYVGAYTDSQTYPYRWYDFKWVTITRPSAAALPAPPVAVTPARKQEIWKGKATGATSKTIWGITINYTLDFDIEVKYSPPVPDYNGTANITGTATVTGVTLDNSARMSQPNTKVTGGMVNNGKVPCTGITKGSGEIRLLKDVGDLTMSFGNYSDGKGTSVPLFLGRGIVLIPESITDTTASGKWRFGAATNYYVAEDSPTYRFTLTKQNSP